MDTKFSSDIAFTPSVKAVQAGRGSRKAYAEFEARGGFRTQITPDLIALLSEVDTAYLVTANAAGQPYAQHKGGPKGFIRALDETTLGFELSPDIPSMGTITLYPRNAASAAV